MARAAVLWLAGWGAGCGGEPTFAPPLLATRPQVVGPAPSRVRARGPDEPRVVALRPRPRWATKPQRRASLGGFGFGPHDVVLPGSPAPAAQTRAYRSWEPFDETHAVALRLDGKTALVDTADGSLLALPEAWWFRPVTPAYLVGFRNTGLLSVDRATGALLAQREREGPPDLYASSASPGWLVDSEEGPPGTGDDSTRVLGLPGLATRLELRGRVVLERLGPSGALLVEGWRTPSGKKAKAHILAHELMVLDPAALKVQETVRVPAEAGSAPLEQLGMWPPPRHVFDASRDGTRLAMGFGDGVWTYERKTKQWKTLHKLSPPKSEDDVLTEWEFSVGFTPKADAICAQYASGTRVFPPPQRVKDSTLRAELSAGGCVTFWVPELAGFEPVKPVNHARYLTRPTALSADGKLAASLHRAAGGDGDDPREYRVTVLEPGSNRVLAVFSVGKRAIPSIDDHVLLSFTADGKLWVYAMGADAFGGTFDPTSGARLGPAEVDPEDPSLSFASVLQRIGRTPPPGGMSPARKAASGLELVVSEGEEHPLPLSGGEASGVDGSLWLPDRRVSLAWDGVSLHVHHVPLAPGEPGVHVATLVPRPSGVVALLQGGGYHVSGDVPEQELGCLSGDTLAPIASCRGRFWVEDGARRALSGKVDWLEP